MEITLILDNIRSTYNVGAILRTAEGFGVKEVIFSGYTPFPGKKPGTLPHVSEKLTRQIAKTALGAETMLKLTPVPDIKQFLAAIASQNAKNAKISDQPPETNQKSPENCPNFAPIIALENNLSDSRLKRLSDLKPALNGAKRAYLIAGEEVSGINPAIYPYIDFFAEIPMRGQKESFNVSVATGIALYELTK